MKEKFENLLKIFCLVAILAFCFMVFPFADVREDALKNNTFIALSQQDKKDTISFIVKKVASDLNIKNVPSVSFYKGGKDSIAAYNSLANNTVFVNQDIFSDIDISTKNGLTFENYLVNILAHEVRHQYQEERKNDGSVYGNKCLDSYINYIKYSEDPVNYYKQFVEKDAYDYGKQYADNYISDGYLTNADLNTKLLTKDGKIFDAVFYAKNYPDAVAIYGSRPTKLLEHYNKHGIKEGKKPNANI